MSNGYHVQLPWKNRPTTERLRVVARLTLPDGRVFEADRDVRVRPTPGRHSALVVPRDMQVAKPADLWREGRDAGATCEVNSPAQRFHLHATQLGFGQSVARRPGE